MHYGSVIREMLSVRDSAFNWVTSDTVTTLGLNVINPDPRAYFHANSMDELADTINRVTLSQPTQPDTIEMPIDIFNSIRTGAVKRVTDATNIEDIIKETPSMADHIPFDLRMESVSQFHKWAAQQATTDQPNTPPPATIRLTSPSSTNQYESIQQPPAPPSIARGPIVNQPPEDYTMGELDLADTITNEIPTVQTMGAFVATLRESKYGALPEIAELSDLEVMISYVITLLMILGKNTATNTGISQYHDWYSTLYKYRTNYINGYYASWQNRKAAWSGEQPLHNQRMNNSLIAAMGTITATAIRMTDEHLLKALAEGSNTTEEKVYHQIVGRQNYKMADADACRILKSRPNDPEKRLGFFELAEDGKGRLYDSIIEFLPNSTLTRALRTTSQEVDLRAYAITNEHPVQPKPQAPAKRKKAAPVTKVSTPSPAQKKRKAVVTRASPPDEVEVVEGWNVNRIPLRRVIDLGSPTYPQPPIQPRYEEEDQEEELGMKPAARK
jgi:hypothetical protein